MSQYVDGYVLPVANGEIEAYREMAAEAGQLWIEHGALQFVESVGDDLDPEIEGAEFTTFPDLVDSDPDETILFSFVVFESRAHRDEVNAAVMEEMGDEPDEMPFDVTRMAYGGFEAIVDLERPVPEQSVESAE